jgi:hypothetical protein
VTPVSGSFVFVYYTGSTVSGTPSTTAPTDAGTYTVVAIFTSTDTNYSSGSAQITFTINPPAQAARTLRVSGVGWTLEGSSLPATAL